MANNQKVLRVLQIINHYEAPFLDVARQYAVLFKGTSTKMVTVFLRGVPSDEVRQQLTGNEVIFLDLEKSQVRGLKLKAIQQVRKLHRLYDFNLCIAHRYHPTKIATQVGHFPVVSINHTFNLYSRWERRFYINRKRRRLTLLNVSNAVRDETRSCFPNWPEKKIRTFYNHVDVEAMQALLLSRKQARSVLALPQNSFVIANVGRLHKDKDQKTLLDAFSEALPRLPENALLAIYGKGPLEEALKRQALQLGINDRVVFGGFVKHLSRHFRAFDVFALASDNEPFGMVLLEAMLAKVLIVASKGGGVPEVLGPDGNFFMLGNSAQLADLLVSTAEKQTSEVEKILQSQLGRVQQKFSDESAIHAFRQELSRLGLG